MGRWSNKYEALVKQTEKIEEKIEDFEYRYKHVELSITKAIQELESGVYKVNHDKLKAYIDSDILVIRQLVNERLEEWLGQQVRRQTVNQEIMQQKFGELELEIKLLKKILENK